MFYLPYINPILHICLILAYIKTTDVGFQIQPGRNYYSLYLKNNIRIYIEIDLSSGNPMSLENKICSLIYTVQISNFQLFIGKGNNNSSNSETEETTIILDNLQKISMSDGDLALVKMKKFCDSSSDDIKKMYTIEDNKIEILIHYILYSSNLKSYLGDNFLKLSMLFETNPNSGKNNGDKTLYLKSVSRGTTELNHRKHFNITSKEKETGPGNYNYWGTASSYFKPIFKNIMTKEVPTSFLMSNFTYSQVKEILSSDLNKGQLKDKIVFKSYYNSNFIFDDTYESFSNYLSNANEIILEKEINETLDLTSYKTEQKQPDLDKDTGNIKVKDSDTESINKSESEENENINNEDQNPGKNLLKKKDETVKEITTNIKGNNNEISATKNAEQSKGNDIHTDLIPNSTKTNNNTNNSNNNIIDKPIRNIILSIFILSSVLVISLIVLLVMISKKSIPSRNLNTGRLESN